MEYEEIFWNEGRRGGKKKRYVCFEWNGEKWLKCYRSNYMDIPCRGWEKKYICIRPLNKEVSPDEWEYYDFVEIP